MNRILIAEDEPRIASFIEKGLRSNGFVTTVVADGDSALDYGRSGQFDLLVLDLGLPKRDGMSVLNTLRGEGHRLPVVVLTARDSVADTVNGLESGADDYISKPFSFAELLARVRARLRPSDGAGASMLLTVDNLVLDLRTRRVSVDGQAVDLTAREFALAEVFFRHPDQVLTRQQLLSQVWDISFDPGSNVVDVYVRYLRRKLGGRRIETLRGVGYRLHAKVGGDDDDGDENSLI